MKFKMMLLLLNISFMSYAFEQEYDVFKKNITNSSLAVSSLRNLLQNHVVTSAQYTELFRFLYNNVRYDLLGLLVQNSFHVQLVYSLDVVYGLVSKIVGTTEQIIDQKIVLMRIFTKACDWHFAEHVRGWFIRQYYNNLLHDIEMYQRNGGDQLKASAFICKLCYILSNELKVSMK